MQIDDVIARILLTSVTGAVGPVKVDIDRAMPSIAAANKDDGRTGLKGL
jgi:hypothetical protein